MSDCNCKKDKCLSPAVLQINNQDCPTVFHKVTFPAAMGDDKTNPPRNGQYRNVLLVYEANGHVYMFSSDGIPTFISDGGQGVDDYNELTNKPSIEGHELVGDSSLEDIGVTDAIEEALEDYTPTSDLAEVAFSGDYDDLENTPTPPVTHFYRHGSGGIEDSFPFYNDADFTDQTTYQQFEDAILSGPVQVLHEYDAGAYTIGNVEMTNAEVGYNVAFWVSGEKERQVFRWMYTDSAPVLESIESYSYQPDWNVNNPNSFAYIRNKPTIPTVNDATLTITQNGASAGTFTANASSNATINLTDTTYSNFGGATSSAAGASGLVPAPAAGDQTKYLMGDGTWGEVQLPPSRTVLYVRTNLSYLTSPFYIYKDSSRTTPITWDEMRALLNAEDGGEVVIRVMDSSDSTYCIVSFEHDMAWFGVIDASQEHDSAAIYHFHEDYDDSTRSKFVIEKQELGGGLIELSYGNSTWSDFIAAYQAGKIVYCRASSNTNPATGSQTRKAFMAYVNNAENPTEVEFQYVRSVSSKTASQPVDQMYVYKLTSANGGTWTVESRNMAPKLAAGTNATVSYSNGTYTISATGGGSGPTVVQTTGQSTTSVMSQKAVTDIIGNVETILQTLNSGNGAQQ